MGETLHVTPTTVMQDLSDNGSEAEELMSDQEDEVEEQRGLRAKRGHGKKAKVAASGAGKRSKGFEIPIPGWPNASSLRRPQVARDSPCFHRG